MNGRRVVVGIAGDVGQTRAGRPRTECAAGYALGLARAGATPVLLPPIVEQVAEQLELCDAIVLTGGDDPQMEAFGKPTHPKATPMHPLRQAYDTALLVALERESATPVLGVCLGMQMMALVAGGDLDQHLPETIATHERHAGSAEHEVEMDAGARLLAGSRGVVCSHHKQAVSDAGRLRVCAVSDDGVVEAIDDPGRTFYVGVQWHPERTVDPTLGQRVFDELVRAARDAREGRG
jgi:putative glutamine amidotransferase